MTDQELREKIVEILTEVCEPIEYGDDDIHGAQIYFPSNEDIANALISAGFGDVSELKKHRLLLLDDGTIKQLYSGEEIEKIVKEREEYKHRAEVVERALREFAVQCGCNKCPFLGRCNISADAEGDYQGCFNVYLSIAEKELAEERKDD